MTPSMFQETHQPEAVNLILNFSPSLETSPLARFLSLAEIITTSTVARKVQLEPSRVATTTAGIHGLHALNQPNCL